MIINYIGSSKSIIRLNEEVTNFDEYECLDCGHRMSIEKGLTWKQCIKCNGNINKIKSKSKKSKVG